MRETEAGAFRRRRRLSCLTTDERRPSGRGTEACLNEDTQRDMGQPTLATGRIIAHGLKAPKHLMRKTRRCSLYGFEPRRSPVEINEPDLRCRHISPTARHATTGFDAKPSRLNTKGVSSQRDRPETALPWPIAHY